MQQPSRLYRFADGCVSSRQRGRHRPVRGRLTGPPEEEEEEEEEDDDDDDDVSDVAWLPDEADEDNVAAADVLAVVA